MSETHLQVPERFSSERKTAVVTLGHLISCKVAQNDPNTQTTAGLGREEWEKIFMSDTCVGEDLRGKIDGM